MKQGSILLGALLFGVATSAGAAPVVLDFEGVSASYPFDTGVAIGDFYNGGLSSDGTSGANYGIAFDDNAEAFCLNTPGAVCSNSARGGLAPSSATAGLALAQDGETVIDIAAGFSDAFSFAYAQPYVFAGDLGSVLLFDGLGGTGNLLGFLDLGLTSSGSCGADYADAVWCPFELASIGFAGVAKSVVLGGTADYLVFDDLSFGKGAPDDGNGGTVIPGVPEPASWAMLILGFGLIGVSARRRNTHRHAPATN